MTEKRITIEDVVEAIKYGQMTAEDKFREMVKVGNRYVLSSESGNTTYGILGLMGFAGVHFKNLKNKNDLKKISMISPSLVRVYNDYPSGFGLTFRLECPRWATELHPEACAYFSQSVDIKEAAHDAFLDVMNSKGFLIEDHVKTRLD